MSYFVYAFEAKDIQKYILERTRLAEMMGASGLIDALCEEVLDTVLAALGLKEAGDSRVGDFYVSRRGGGGFTLVFLDKTKAERLRDLVSLVIPQFAPDLPFVHAVGTHPDVERAIQDALAQLPLNEQDRWAPLPVASPLVFRAPRTGLPAWGNFPKFNDEAIDRAALVKRRFREDRLGKKFLDDVDYYWPRNLNPEDPEASEETLFPFVGENHRVAIVHVDGNGFGQALEEVRKAAKSSGGDPIAVEYAFSRAVGEMGRQAVESATMEVLMPRAKQLHAGPFVMPARPLVLGGDDLTLILRADLALDFVEHYILEFEGASKDLIKKFSLAHGISLPYDRMTACAGIAFVGAKRPFDRAYQLAEALCDEAKSAAKSAARGLAPSFLVFGESTSSLPRQEDAMALSPQGICVAGTAYHLGTVAAASAPSFSALRALKELVTQSDELARSPLHEVVERMRQDEDEAGRRWQRWRTVVGKRGPAGQGVLRQLEEKLTAVAPGYALKPDSPVLSHPHVGDFCPLGDVLVWSKAEAKFNATE